MALIFEILSLALQSGCHVAFSASLHMILEAEGKQNRLTFFFSVLSFFSELKHTALSDCTLIAAH